MNLTVAILLFIIYLVIIIEVKFSPRLDIIETQTQKQLVIWYSIKSKIDPDYQIYRDKILLFKF